VNDFYAWLNDLATEPLPGGVSAAAVSAAMGTALIVKTVQATLQHQALDSWDRTALEATLERAHAQRAMLLCLADADQQAYQAVLHSRRMAVRDPARNQAWQTATEVPLCVAEACDLLLERLSHLEAVCWPAVRADLEIGSWLLETGLRAGLLAAENNVQVWGERAHKSSFRTRMEALRRGDMVGALGMNE
jgi:formiminotetrahydrofolate cyclodeaminase